MVRDLVLDNFDSKSVGLIHQLAQFRERAEMFFDTIKVDRAITMIIGDLSFGSVRFVRILFALVEVIDVVVPRRQPNRRHPEFFQIRKMVDDSLKIAAVVVTWFRAIEKAFRLGRVVVCRIAIAEPIRHDQIDDIVGGKTLESPSARQGLVDFKWRFKSASRGSDSQRLLPATSYTTDGNINEQIRASRIDLGLTCN